MMPKSLNWNPDLCTGHARIDEQHRQIFDLFNDLLGRLHQPQETHTIRHVLGVLSVYVVAHFRMEEELMAEAGLPGLEPHRASHDALRHQVEALVDRYNESGLELADLLEFLAWWLEVHVRKQDMPMVESLALAGAEVG